MASVSVEPAESAADALVRRAHAGAYRYPADFAGFRASVVWHVDGRSSSGIVVARIGPEIEIELEADAAEEDRAWVERELRSIVGHRRASTYESGDGRHAKHVGDDLGHPLGTVVEMDDEYGSSYRVSGDEISTVTRTLTASCPAGKTAVGGGGAIVPANNPGVAVSSSYLTNATTWPVNAREIVATAANWSINAFVVCATVAP